MNGDAGDASALAFYFAKGKVEKMGRKGNAGRPNMISTVEGALIPSHGQPTISRLQ